MRHNLRSNQQSIAPMIEYGIITVLVGAGTVLGGLALWMWISQAIDSVVRHSLVH